MLRILVVVISLCCLLDGVRGHGRLVDPPSRATMWRYLQNEFPEQPSDYNDNQGFCGGASVSVAKRSMSSTAVPA